MKLLGFLNLKGISGQIAALVVASIVAIHLILTATFLIHRPDQPDPSIDRGHSQLVAVTQLLGTAPAAERPRLLADIAQTFPQLEIESLPPGSAPRRTTARMYPTAQSASPPRQQLPDLFARA